MSDTKYKKNAKDLLTFYRFSRLRSRIRHIDFLNKIRRFGP